MASDYRLFGKISEPGWVLMDLNNSFKCRNGRRGPCQCTVRPQALEPATYHWRNHRRSEDPSLAGDLHLRDLEPGRMAGGFKSTAKQMSTVSSH